jgi:hypothetical protein
MVFQRLGTFKTIPPIPQVTNNDLASLDIPNPSCPANFQGEVWMAIN